MPRWQSLPQHVFVLIKASSGSQVLDKEAMERAGAEAEVMHEVNIMKQIEHPNVVNLREIIASRESIFLVMEYVPGGDLFDHVAKHGAMKVTNPPNPLFHLLPAF
jgi:serine/threonine protein kinase